MTDLLDGLLAGLVSMCLNLFILSRLRRGFPPQEAAFLRPIYVWTLILRHFGAVLLNAYATDSQFAQSFWGDSETYDYGGLLLSQTWTGKGFWVTRASSSASGYGFHYFVGALYFVFGRNQLLVQFVNATIGSVTVPVVYTIAKSLFGPPAARFTALFLAFFPQMIFWSCGMYKDPAILLCIAVAMYAVMRLREAFSLRLLAVYAGSGLALLSLRFYVFYVVAFATLGTFLFTQRRGLFGGLIVQIALALTLGGGIFFGVRAETLEQQRSFMDFEQLQVARYGQSTLGRSAYAAEANVSTPAGALSALPTGLAYLLFAPFPWAITGTRQLLTLPETLVWYALMPALFRGLRFTLRTRLREALPILVFAFTLTLAYAVFQSNVGTAYRQRTQITMFFFVFMGAGLEQKRQQRQKRSQRGQGLPRPALTRTA